MHHLLADIINSVNRLFFFDKISEKAKINQIYMYFDTNLTSQNFFRQSSTILYTTRQNIF